MFILKQKRRVEPEFTLHFQHSSNGKSNRFYKFVPQMKQENKQTQLKPNKV